MFPGIGINLRVRPESMKTKRRRPRWYTRIILRQLSKVSHQSMLGVILVGANESISSSLNMCSSFIWNCCKCFIMRHKLFLWRNSREQLSTFFCLKQVTFLFHFIIRCPLQLWPDNQQSDQSFFEIQQSLWTEHSSHIMFQQQHSISTFWI